MKSKLLNLVTHPALISFIIWLIVIFSLSELFSEYKVKKVNEIFCGNSINYYYDLDGDNESERIYFDLADNKQTKTLIFKGNKIIDQFNIEYQPVPGIFYYAGDYNHDGFSECFVFTMNEDSIFLTVIDPLVDRSYVVGHRFIDIAGKSVQSVNRPNIHPVTLIQNDQTGSSDFIFMISAGFSLKPRRLYRYIIESDSLIKSPESTACIVKYHLTDINDDQVPEILLNTHASANAPKETPYSDWFGWLMVIDKNMKFVFPPVRFLEYPSYVKTVPLKTDGTVKLVIFHDYCGTDTISSAFYLYNNQGRQLSRSPVTGYEISNSELFPNAGNNLSSFYFLKNLNGDIEEIDCEFSTISKFKIPPLIACNPLAFIDADSDGENEYFFQGEGDRSLIIVRNDFSDPVSLPMNTSGVLSVSPVITRNEKPKVYVQAGETGVFLQYSGNPVYYFKYPFYLALYGLLLLFILLIFRLQRYRIRVREEMGKQMAALQMKAIKNQLDPHFTLNVLNSIGSLYASESSREQADYIFGKYARLIRETVISSDQIIIPLADEMEFIKNYIDLERFRCNDAFSYKIETDPDINLQKKIPRMLIHTFVENSIKHGLKDSGGKGVLKIAVRGEPGRYIITIEDNNSGTGRKDEKSTGKGLTIIKELIDLYFRLEKVQITFSLKPVPDGDNQVIGRAAKIEIPV